MIHVIIYTLCSCYVFFSVVVQKYVTDVFREQVIMGNDVLFKCQIPSFVADHVLVDSWVDSENVTLHQKSQGKLLRKVIIQLK